MKPLPILCIAIFCFHFQLSAQDYSRHYLRLKDLQAQYDNIDGGNRMDHRKELSSLITEIQNIPGFHPLKGILLLDAYAEQIKHLNNEISETGISSTEWCESNDFNSLISLLNAYRETEPKIPTFPSTIEKEFSTLNRSTLRAFNLYPLEQNKDKLQELVFSSLGSPERQELIRESEIRIYDIIVGKKPTVKQLEYFISNANYADVNNTDDVYNFMADTAFLKLLEIQTQDGEEATLHAFENSISNKMNTLWEVLLNKYSDILDTKRSVVSINKDEFRRINSVEELSAFIERNPDSELAFVALQSYLGSKTGFSQTDLDDLFSQLEPLWQGNNIQKARSYHKLFRNRTKKPLQQLVGIDGTTNVPMRLNISPNDTNSIAVIYPTTQQVRVYTNNGETWSATLKTTQQTKRFYSFKFDTKNVNQTSQFDFYSHFEHFNTSALTDGLGFVTDFHIYWNGEARYAFFISNAKAGRYADAGTECEEPEYPSPYIIQDMTLHQNNSFFHGKERGNTNTDIYYSVYDTRTGVWTRPKLLVGVNDQFNINSPFSERSPYFDGDKLYFSSEGHVGIGGYDVFSVSLTRPNAAGEIFVNSVPKNLEAINTFKDELYYYRVIDKDYLVSNRGDNPDNYFVYSNSTEKTNETVYDPGEQRIDWGKIYLEMKCDIDLEFPMNIKGKENHLRLWGRIFDNDGTQLRVAKVVFQDQNGLVISATINSSSDNKYRVELKKDELYTVQVFAYNDDTGEKIESYADFVVRTCENTLDNVAVHDIVFNQEDRTGSLGPKDESSYRSILPFFFNTGRSVVLERGEQVRQIDTHYKNILEEFLEQEDVYCSIVLFGYADKRGADSFNCHLSEQRCLAVKNYLIDLGFPADRIFINPVGETDDFNVISDDEIEAYNRLKIDLQRITSQDVKWQLNRRVNVVLNKGCEEPQTSSDCRQKQLRP